MELNDQANLDQLAKKSFETMQISFGAISRDMQLLDKKLNELDSRIIELELFQEAVIASVDTLSVQRVCEYVIQQKREATTQAAKEYKKDELKEVEVVTENSHVFLMLEPSNKGNFYLDAKMSMIPTFANIDLDHEVRQLIGLKVGSRIQLKASGSYAYILLIKE